jgi:hypothetical protein
VAYVPKVDCIHAAPDAETIGEALFGGMPFQLGYCNGHNTKLNCLEYHRDSEFNLGMDDFILLIAKQDEIDDEGKLDSRMKSKVFEMLGLGNWESASNLEDTHARRALRENLGVEDGVVPEISELDDHDLHVAEHTRHLLAGEKTDGVLLEHVKKHLELKAISQMAKENIERKGE